MDREGNEALLGIFFGVGKLKDSSWIMALFLRMLILGRCIWSLLFNPWKISSLEENSFKLGRET